MDSQQQPLNDSEYFPEDAPPSYEEVLRQDQQAQQQAKRHVDYRNTRSPSPRGRERLDCYQIHCQSCNTFHTRDRFRIFNSRFKRPHHEIGLDPYQETEHIRHHEIEIGGSDCPGNRHLDHLPAELRLNWWNFHLVARHYAFPGSEWRSLEDLHLQHQVGRQTTQVVPCRRSDRILLLIKSWNELKDNYQLDVDVASLPRCRHLQDSSTWISLCHAAHQAYTAHLRGDQKYLSQVPSKRREHLKAPEGVCSSIFRCRYCPTEYRFRTRNYWCGPYRPKKYGVYSFVVEQWVDLGLCRSIMEPEWQSLVRDIPQDQDDASTPYDLGELASIKSRFERHAETETDLRILSPEQYLQMWNDDKIKRDEGLGTDLSAYTT